MAREHAAAAVHVFANLGSVIIALIHTAVPAAAFAIEDDHVVGAQLGNARKQTRVADGVQVVIARRRRAASAICRTAATAITVVTLLGVGIRPSAVGAIKVYAPA